MRSILKICALVTKATYKNTLTIMFLSSHVQLQPLLFLLSYPSFFVGIGSLKHNYTVSGDGEVTAPTASRSSGVKGDI